MKNLEESFRTMAARIVIYALLTCIIFGSTSTTAAPTPTKLPTAISPFANQDIGCNYVNINGVAIPMDYCMDFSYSGLELGMQFVCDATGTDVTFEVYRSQECDGIMPIKSFSMMDPDQSLPASYDHLDIYQNQL